MTDHSEAARIEADIRQTRAELDTTFDALRDALTAIGPRFDSFYIIQAGHNAVAPFDMGGAYDEASDRRQDLSELMERAYEDAYRQFIEPIIGASGEQLAHAIVGAREGRRDDFKLP